MAATYRPDPRAPTFPTVFVSRETARVFERESLLSTIRFTIVPRSPNRLETGSIASLHVYILQPFFVHRSFPRQSSILFLTLKSQPTFVTTNVKLPSRVLLESYSYYSKMKR